MTTIERARALIEKAEVRPYNVESVPAINTVESMAKEVFPLTLKLVEAVLEHCKRYHHTCINHPIKHNDRCNFARDLLAAIEKELT